MNKNKHENYEILNLLGYGLAKFGNLFIHEFGLKTKTEFYKNMMKYGIAETESVIKNRQDLFDPFFDNGRKGWWQKGNTYIHRKHFIDSFFGSLNVISYAEIVKMYLQEQFNYWEYGLLTVKPIIKSQFKQLQKTGLEAEMYFFNNYKSMDIFSNGRIEDTRLFGDGYDFQIEVNSNFFLAEVKGVRNKKGSIRLTNNEYIKANEYKDNYILSIISNLNDIPKITLIPNPLEHLELSEKIVQQEQIIFSTKIFNGRIKGLIMLTLKEKQLYFKDYLLVQNGSYADKVKDSIYDYFFEFKEEELSNFIFLDRFEDTKDIKNKIEFLVSKIILHEDDDSFENLLHEYILKF